MKSKRKKTKLTSEQLQNMADKELLKQRIRDLGLTIEGTVLEERIKRLYEELTDRGIPFQPPCYLTYDWLCPDKEPIVGIPFYLAHPRLVQLERKMMLEVEGGTDSWCMKLLRHETGHAINYAYRLYRRTRWRELFGPFSAKYSEDYYAHPYSKRYVIHLEDNYAQAHPDEDFAETFAVWLAPTSNWQKKYQGWPAMKKLQYVDHIMQEITDKKPLVTTNDTPWAASRMYSTLLAYYERRRLYMGDEFPGYYVPSLMKIFYTTPGSDDLPTAARFLRKERRHIVNIVSTWTGQRKFDIDKLIRKLIARCDDLNLYLHKPETDVLPEVTAFVTAVMNNVHIFEGGFNDQ